MNKNVHREGCHCNLYGDYLGRVVHDCKIDILVARLHIMSRNWTKFAGTLMLCPLHAYLAQYCTAFVLSRVI